MKAAIDCNNLCYRAFHTPQRGLSCGEDPTGVIFGFLNQLFHFIETSWGWWGRVEPYFFWDSRKSFRRDIFPGYKLKPPPADEREQKAYESLYTQMGILRLEILPTLGWLPNVEYREGFEADDLIAHFCKKEFQSIILSSDEDLYQLLSDEGPAGRVCAICKPADYSLYSVVNFRREYGAEPEIWADVKAIAGCTSDKVPGVPGVGPVTAIKYLKGQLKTDTKAYQKIKINKDLIERNKRLVTLPLGEAEVWKSWDMRCREDFPKPLLRENFYSVFKQFGFKSFQRRLDSLSISLGLR